MKKIYYIIIISFLLITCKSSNEVNPITTLELTVLYNKTLVGGATVYLFADSSDYQTAIKGSEISQSIPTKVTGSNGTVTFSGLAAQNYWIYVTYEQNG